MRYETTVDIDHPIEDVWKFLVDPFSIPRWDRGWLSIRKGSPGPLGLGSTFNARMMMLGFEWRLSGEVVEWDPPRAASFMVHGRIGSALLRARLETTEAGTRVVRISELQPRSVVRPILWLLGAFLRRRSDAYNQQFKHDLEAELGLPAQPRGEGSSRAT